ncbi:hypothetical protein [Argonema antarcticum]|uniref:hypothetical protein n=1 Tax=Argonema antarcticum TaxID=2942763 RepID=UPI0020125F9C|nr:hypothetical protein [Argonema antarcticum]MCL1470008.1 hypothetical protein [Argonema antarcticum A004/B2]
MLDPKEFGEILSKHFAEVTPEQFIENLKKYCPEVFEDEIEESEIPQRQTDRSKNELEKKAALSSFRGAVEGKED